MTQVRQAWALGVRKRATNVKALKKAGGQVSRLAAQSLLFAGIYGHGVLGAVWSTIARLRAAVHVAIYLHCAGRSATIDRALAGRKPAKFDPAYVSIRGPVVSAANGRHDAPHLADARPDLGARIFCDARSRGPGSSAATEIIASLDRLCGKPSGRNSHSPRATDTTSVRHDLPKLSPQARRAGHRGFAVRGFGGQMALL